MITRRHTDTQTDETEYTISRCISRHSADNKFEISVRRAATCLTVFDF